MKVSSVETNAVSNARLQDSPAQADLQARRRVHSRPSSNVTDPALESLQTLCHG